MALRDADDLPSPFLVQHDGVDWDIFRFLRSRLPPIKLLETNHTVFAQISEFLFEAFALFYKEQPIVVPEEERPAAAQFRGKLLEYLMRSPAYYAMVAQSTLDEFLAVLASIRVSEELLRVLRKWAGSHGGQVPSGVPVDPELERELIAAFAGAMTSAREEQEELTRWAQGWGTQPGKLTKLPVEEKFALMEKLQRVKQLQAISLLAGRATEIAQKKRGERIPQDHGEVTGVTRGGDLARVLPSEFALLARARLRRLFRVRLAERSLAVLECRPRTALGRGPLVVCIDTSGSMGGQREVWAKAVACALYVQARQDHRTYGYMHFSSETELRTVVVPRDAEGLDQLIDLATYAFGGGTNFDVPLREALRLIESEAELRKADIVFITDGECMVSPGVLQRIAIAKRQLGLSVIGVLIQEGVSRADIEAKLRAGKNAEDEVAKDALTPEEERAWNNGTATPEVHAKAARWYGRLAGMEPIAVMLSFCDHLYPIAELTADAVASVFDPILS